MMTDYTEISKLLRNCSAINGGCTTCPMIGKTCCVMTLQGDADDAIEELLAEVKHWELEAAANETDRNYLIDENRKLVNSLMNFRVPTWISVDDELPDVAIGVLCYCPINKCSYTACFDGERWWHFGGTSPIWFDVTHWMPLPESPKGDYDAGFVAGWNRAVREITNQIAQAEIAYAQKYSRKKRGSAHDKCGVQAVSRGREAAPEADTEAAQAADPCAVGGLGADHAHELGADAEREIP